MHSLDVGSSNIAAFLVKLWKIVEDPDTDDLIEWSPSGNSFIIHNQARFAKELLPLYFKHSNMASFIRQLNMYGFRKLSSLEQGNLRFERDEVEFYHQHFVKGKYSHLENIKRKMPTSKPGEKVRSEILRDVIDNVNNIRTEQANVDQLLKTMKEENTALWREVALLRQKYMKQQEIIAKLIQFLATLVKPNCKIGLKRKLPLMIDNGNSGISTDSKISRLSQQLPKESLLLKSNYSDSANFAMTSNSPNGPVIHDVTDSLEEEPLAYVDASSVASPQDSGHKLTCSVSSLPSDAPSSSEVLEPLVLFQDSSSPFQEVLSPEAESILPDKIMPEDSSLDTPESILPDKIIPEDKSLNTPSSLSEPLTPCSLFPNTTFSAANEKNDTVSEDTTENMLSKANSSQMQLAISTSSDSLTKNTFSDHLDSIERDLDWLHEQLSTGGLNIDSSTLLGVCSVWNPLETESKLFSSDDSAAGNFFPYESEQEKDGNAVTGTELIQYTPSLDASLLDSALLTPKSLNDDLLILPEAEITDLPTLSVDPLLCDQKHPPFTD